MDFEVHKDLLDGQSVCTSRLGVLVSISRKCSKLIDFLFILRGCSRRTASPFLCLIFWEIACCSMEWYHG